MSPYKFSLFSSCWFSTLLPLAIMSHSDSDDLPPTLQYDPYESQFSDERAITATTTILPPDSPTVGDTAPHSGSTFDSIHPTILSSDSYTTSYDNNGDSSGSQQTVFAILEEERRRNLNHPPSQEERNRLAFEAEQRLFRTRSANSGYDGVGFFSGNNKRKCDFTTAEKVVRQYALTRGFTDLTTIASDWAGLYHYPDVPRLRGKIDPKLRQYLDEGVNVDNLIASMDTNSISSSSEKTQPFSGNTSLDPCPADISTSFVSHSLTSESTTSQATSTQSLLPSIPETTLPAATSTAPEPASPLQQVESTCPIDDLEAKNSLENDDEDDDSDNHHLNDYSPGQKDDFARQVSLQPSSTPLRPHIQSSFPEDDLEALKETAELYTIDDSPPPRKHQLGLASSSSSARLLRSNSLFDGSITSPFSSDSPLPCIMFTSTVNDQKYRRVAKSMGATIVSSWELCTHMVTDTFRRTPNLLCALATQKYIVNEDWIKVSISKGQFEDTLEYDLGRQNPPNYFAGKTLFFKATTNIKRADANDLAKAAGAKVRLRAPELNLNNGDRSLVVVCADDDDAQPYQEAGYQAISRAEFLELYEKSD
ncbi:hypothetical protein [Absidia glauca]|uniref:BRCT domain-containing protein n=1 Tax=Absidia glauca TaxID=4829 RepID=A0A163JQM8_ABSGL|nr:hypothetical protein [Absidia glauca]